jgi:hypothetical protein
MTLVTPVRGGDPDSVLSNECEDLLVLISWQLADALMMPCRCYSVYILVQFMCSCTHVHVTHALGEPCREHSPLVAHSYVDVPNSYEQAVRITLF